MSAGHLSRRQSLSSRSRGSRSSDRALAQQTAVPPETTHGSDFEPCAATASFFIHAQRNVIFLLHHDTLAIERRFEKHREDVLLISADNVSENGTGRLVVSYDASQTAIVWDIFNGEETARFASYERIRVASWMRDGSIAFGNDQGNIILFYPSNSEHVAARTIFDPVTALAPAADNRTFALGYQNGSILIATLHPFTILHTLHTSRAPSPIANLAWHGSSSKQRTDMLATQTADGDLRVWSVAKSPESDAPRSIRVLGGADMAHGARNWFAWSKNGRIVQFTDGETRAWDVRTKRVAYENVPTIDHVAGIANYGPTASLFTMGPDHTIQQYDLNPTGGVPVKVAQAQHAPVNAPPTPPDSMPRETPPPLEPPAVETTGSEDEEAAMSPLAKIAHEMDAIEEERELRDKVAPLSPVSSRASSRNSMSSASSGGRRNRYQNKNRLLSSRHSDEASEGTTFSGISSMRSGTESVSIRSISTASSRQPSSLRQEMLRSPEETKQTKSMDLFPYTKARLSEVKFRPPEYSNTNLTPDVLRREMLSVVFGWEDDIEDLIREELDHHSPGSAPSVMLAKWLGDVAADAVTQMVGSESMTSSDWMLLALSCQMGQGSQKQVGEAFVRRLLETDEIHPAVAILLGLGEQNDAVEAYVSRRYYLEAVLLTCLLFPTDWQRQSYLVRKWGEKAVADKQAEFAVRCFSCTSIESSEPWFSPRAQDAVFAAQQQQYYSQSPPVSPPSAGAPNRLTAKNASLKLITKFDEEKAPKPQATQLGVTPIIDSAVSPGGFAPKKRSGSRGLRDPSSARTATPGGYTSRRRDPSVGLSARDNDEATPMVDDGQSSRPGSRTSHKREPSTAVKSRRAPSDTLPSPAPGVFNPRRERSRPRELSRDRNHHNLQLQMVNTVEIEDANSSYPASASTRSRRRQSQSSMTQASGHTHRSRADDTSPLPTDGSTQNFKGRNIDRFINSLEEANYHAEQERAQSRSRNERSRSRARQREGSDVHYIRPSKRSPSSPVPMTSDDAKRLSDRETVEGGRQSAGSPVDSRSTRGTSRSRTSKSRATSKNTRRHESPDARGGVRSGSRQAGRACRQESPERFEIPSSRGRGHTRVSSGARSPPSPSPMESCDVAGQEHSEAFGDSLRPRQHSSGRHPSDSGRCTASPDRSNRARSGGRKPKIPTQEPASAFPGRNQGRNSMDFSYEDIIPRSRSSNSARPMTLSKKELAAKELEERRLSLARRPSAPAIPHPGELSGGRPNVSPRSMTDHSLLPASTYGDLSRERSHTVDPESMRHNDRLGGTSTLSVPIGLPANPRALKHSRYMTAPPDERDAVPAIPELPEGYKVSNQQEGDKLGPLLPSTVYGQKNGTLPRSASAPPENSAPNVGLPQRPRRGSQKETAPKQPEVVTKVNDIPEEQDHIIVVGEHNSQDPPLLPELQHLAVPPPPPPPPAPPAHHQNTSPVTSTSSGVINIAMDGGQPSHSRTNTPATVDPPPMASTASPNMQRRGRGSGDSNTTQNSGTSGFGSKWRNVKERMRSDSRNRNKSPPVMEGFSVNTNVNNNGGGTAGPSPYETVLPQTQFESMDNMAASPMDRNSPPRFGSIGSAGASQSAPAYRNPKDIAREQQGLHGAGPGHMEGGMI